MMPKQNQEENNLTYCFFCSEPITEKKTLEHIIPNSLLGKLGIKEETLDGKGSFQYSRIKVPAHEKCNSGFGSQYENNILTLLNDPENLLKNLESEENSIPTSYSPSTEATFLITTWLSKIYYGLFYNDYLKLNDPDWQAVYKEIIESKNFKLIQSSYRENVGFTLPSSLFVFHTKNEDFDLRTNIVPNALMIKIKSLVLILCIGDGYLTKSYFNGNHLSGFKEHLKNVEEQDPNAPIHLIAYAHILATRLSINKTPSFAISEKQMFNLSFLTGVADPEQFYKLDDNIFKEHLKEIYSGMNIHIS